MTLSIEDVARALPENLKGAATQELTDRINTASGDPVLDEAVRENFVTYSSVLRDGRFKTADYLNAVMYVSFKLMGHSNLEAYQRTFPKRYADLVNRNTSSKDISAYVSAYNKGKLVNMILEQSLVPVWVLNQHTYQEAINTQAHLMVHAQSEKVQCEAANSILTHLAKPKDAVPLIQLDVTNNNGIESLKDMLKQLATRQLEAIEMGVDTREIAAQPLIEKKSAEHEPS